MISIKDNEFSKLTDYLKQNYGINLTKKKVLIEGRLNNLLVEKGFTSFGDYFNNVLNDTSKNELTLLINKLTTNHTFFLREASHFDYFQNKVLPYLEATSKNRDLRIWSAGCSSGEEPYTLAMILDSFFQNEKKLWDKKVLATDISVNVLQIAEKGIYSEEAIKALPLEWKLNYLRKIDKENYQISDNLRKEVIFRIFNLMDEVFPFKKKFQVIFCRNVMIYFDAPTKARLINKFYSMTEPGGYLFIGHSESINREETSYNYVMPGVYRKG